ncbi:MAG: glycosyltransferase [Chloroflexota bacterium]
MMRVTHIIDSLRWGGAQKLLVTFAHAVQGQDIELNIVSLIKHLRGVTIPDELTEAGVGVHFFTSKALHKPKRFYKLIRFLQRERVELIHTHLTYANILGALAGRLLRIPVVSTLHTQGYDPHKDPRLWRLLETWTLRFDNVHLSSVGYTVAESQKRRFPGKPIEVIPNAVRMLTSISGDQRETLRKQLAGDASRPLLISVGRLSPPKGYSDLLSAFATIHQRNPSAVLLIVGDGKLRSELRNKIVSLGLKGHAHLLGARDDVPRLLAVSDLYVSASYWEGLPVALLEAMSAGLPVVATNVGDIPEVLDEGMGVLVPPCQPGELAEAICSLLKDEGKMKSLGSAAREHVRKNYDPGTWAQRILLFYADVLSPLNTTSESGGKCR